MYKQISFALKKMLSPKKIIEKNIKQYWPSGGQKGVKKGQERFQAKDQG